MICLRIIPLYYTLLNLIWYCDCGNDKRFVVNNPDDTDQRLRSLEIKLQQLTDTITQLQSTPTAGGAIFIRWGRTTCPNSGSELVYSGYMGGTNYHRQGGAADFLCLVPDPVLDRKTSQNDTYVQRMYGTEYDFSFYQDSDVPCAVCRSKIHSTSLMFPGKNICNNGWTEEYYGLLVSDRYVHTASTQFICIDSLYEAIPGSSANHYGKLVVPVIGKCGSLQCPPYEEDRYFTCVVCSK